ncbi:P24 [Agrotis ipsilon multiple nucleopolyhedrovirus]|uniref:p24 n=1 Tax=Agrotis ipsilon multiple nucleopolyhedrovirus TaxID=208013 RepID=B6D5S9_9ABAC|nr:P24 [Agrotis ipsilon multiple nucleopolyhedrovirus]ACI28717.1 P24 [Agrotis ipsilon multiple nucleopolyhedrovirus]
MYDNYVTNNNNSSGASANAGVVDAGQQFQYNDKLLEVVIIENGDDDRDGYVELTAVAQLVAPIVNIRGFNPAVMWANVHNSQRLTRNNKNYVHAFALGRYLSSYKLSSSSSRPELIVLKQLICDLLMGAQSQVVDPLVDIKAQLCNLQECLTSSSVSSASVATGIMYPLSSSSSSSVAPYESSSSSSHYNEMLRDVLRSEHASLCANISGALETIKSMQADLTNKIAFSNDTMLDGFKSIKDMMSRNKK